jgi:hypothetical protein
MIELTTYKLIAIIAGAFFGGCLLGGVAGLWWAGAKRKVAMKDTHSAWLAAVAEYRAEADRVGVRIAVRNTITTAELIKRIIKLRNAPSKDQ